MIAVSCPTCRSKKVAREEPAFPFCSKECRDADLAGWAEERYKIAGERVRSTDDEAGRIQLEEDHGESGFEPDPFDPE